MNVRTIIAIALVCMTTCAGSAHAEIFNQYCPLPTLSGGANEFVIVFVGDVTSYINTTMTSTDKGVNPFANVGTSTVTATYNSMTNATTVIYTGTTNITSSSSFSYGANSNSLPHFGLDGTGAPQMNVLSQSWMNTSNSSSTALPSLAVNVVNPPMPGAMNVKYITFFADVTSNGLTVGQWFEVPYTTGTSPQLTLTNYTTGTETLSNVGYMLSPTLIPLDNLNFNDAPPPGTPGVTSPFTSLPQYDSGPDSMLSPGDGMGTPGGILTTASLPEPSSLISMATAFLAVGGYLGHRTFRFRRGRTPAGA